MKARIQQLGREAFTLIEVLLVVAILGILASVVVVNFSNRGEKARISACRASIAAVCTALDAYEVDTGRYPPTLKGLIENDGAMNWSGPYIHGGMPKDPWGNELQYTLSEGRYKISSNGPGNGAAPITSW